MLTDLQDARKKADEMLKCAIKYSINNKMKEFNDSLNLKNIGDGAVDQPMSS